MNDLDILRAARQPPKALLTAAERKRYDVRRALHTLASREPAVGFEFDVHNELERRGAVRREALGILVPKEVLTVQRELTTTNAASAGYLVGTGQLEPEPFPRPPSVLLNMGASYVNGLVGPVTIGRLKTGTTPTWLGDETTGSTPAAAAVGSIALNGKDVAVLIEVSRQWMLQTNDSAKSLIHQDLLNGVGQAIDVAGLAGSGGSGQPLGLVNIDITTAIGANVTFEGLVKLQTNAGDSLSPNGGYVAPLAIAELLASRVRFTGTASELWQGNLHRGTVIGYPAMSSANVPAATIVFGGDWSKLVVAEWGEAYEIAVNPYGAKFAAGTLELRVIASIDIAVRVPGAFSVLTDVS